MERVYRERCAARGLDAAAIESSVRAVAALERDAGDAGFELADAPISFVERYMAGLVENGEANEAVVVSIARYFVVARADAVAIRLLAYLLPVGVLPAMATRLGELEGIATRDAVLGHVQIPPEGSPPESYPAATKDFVEALVYEIGEDRARQVLAWHVHGIAPESFASERERYLELGSVDAWLEEWHARQVETLRRHADDGTLWFEQRITHAVVDFVQRNPEIQGGVRVGDTIYVTKIPYDPDRYLMATDPLEKRRLACHCPLAVSAITESGSGVPSLWCSCSAGYTKFPFDIVLGQATEATVLKSVLAGDELCRFAIRLPPPA